MVGDNHIPKLRRFGDDFDRLLATHLLDTANWRWETPAGDRRPADRGQLLPLFDPTTAVGAANFASLVRVAEGIKCELTDSDRVERYVPPRKGTRHVLRLIRDRKYAIRCYLEYEYGSFASSADEVKRCFDYCKEVLA